MERPQRAQWFASHGKKAVRIIKIASNETWLVSRAQWSALRMSRSKSSILFLDRCKRIIIHASLGAHYGSIRVLMHFLFYLWILWTPGSLRWKCASVLIASCFVWIDLLAPSPMRISQIKSDAPPIRLSLSIRPSALIASRRFACSSARNRARNAARWIFGGCTRPPLSVPIVSAHHRGRVEEGSRIKGPLNRVARAWLLRGTSPAGVGFFV